MKNMSVWRSAAQAFHLIGQGPGAFFALSLKYFLVILLILAGGCVPGYALFKALYYKTLTDTTMFMWGFIGSIVWFFAALLISEGFFYRYCQQLLAFCKTGVLDRHVGSAGLRVSLRLSGLILCMFGAVIIGLMLLIVPGIILAVRLRYGMWVLIDQECSIVHALKTSYKLTEGYFWPLAGFSVFSALVGSKLIRIPFITPIAWLIDVHIYQALKTEHQNVSQNAPIEVI